MKIKKEYKDQCKKCNNHSTLTTNNFVTVCSAVRKLNSCSSIIKGRENNSYFHKIEENKLNEFCKLKRRIKQ